MTREESSFPKVTVLMSVYNAERYLAEAIRSILSQTFQDFEFLIIDDGSSDKSKKIIESFHDSRIRLISRANKGLTYSLNQGLRLARGGYIARMDADDVSLPTRLEKEVQVLENDPTIGLVGTNYTIIDEKGHPLATTQVFTHPEDLAVAEILSNQYGHGSVMMRKSVLEQVGFYNPKVGSVEDYDLFIRISRVARIANIGAPLYLWRRNPTGVSLSNQKRQVELAFAVRDRAFRQFLRERGRYKIFSSFHPFSFRPTPLHYLDKKSALFRDLSYLYRQEGKRKESLHALFAAVVFAPWRLRNYRYLYHALRDPSRSPLWEYEFL